MLAQAKKEGVKRARIHPLLDGRDVPPTSALDYVLPFEKFLADLNADGAVDYAIASGGGRMKVTMDRYQADWRMVERGWKTHVRGEGKLYPSAQAAIEALRAATPGVLDQDLPPFVIGRDGKPIGPIVDHDSVILFNFRGDRAIELTRAFEQADFKPFDRGPRPDVLFAGMMQYDGDANIPANFLVTPPRITGTLGEYLADTGVHQLAISETQKFGHVTYFFNGNRAEKFSEALEDYVEVPSDRVPFEERPWMKAAEITDKVIEAIGSGKYRFIRVNYPNGDMVGHTGIFPAVKIAVETVDLCLGRLLPAIRKAGGILVVSADHGNSDDMYEHAKDGAVKYRQGHRPAQGQDRPLPQPRPRRHLRPGQRRQGQADRQARPRHLLPRRHLPQPPRLPGPRQLRPLPRGNRRLSFSTPWKHFFHCVEKPRNIFPLCGKIGRFFPHCGKLFSTVWKNLLNRAGAAA